MPLAAKLTHLTQAAREHGGPTGVDITLFQCFVAASLRQLRAPYLARRTHSEVVSDLADSLAVAMKYSGTTPLVHGSLNGNVLRLWTLMPDQPFIVDTMRLALRAHGWEYVRGFNLMVPVMRDQDGRLVAAGDDHAPLESLTFLEAEVPDPSQVDAGMDQLRNHLLLCQSMVSDYDVLTQLVDDTAHRFARMADQRPAEAADLRETSEFLLWLLTDNFVFMGASSGTSHLGVARAKLKTIWHGDSLSRDWSDDDKAVRVRKGKTESRLHRAGRVDEIRVRIPREGGGQPVDLFIQGMFTYRAVTQPSRHIPWLRRTLSRILSEQDCQPGSYRYKGMANVFDSLPTEFLFTAAHDQVANIIERVLESEQQQDARAQLVQRSDDDMTFALVAMPKGRWSENLRERLQDLLVSSTGATYCDHGVFVGRFDTMLVHFYLTGSRILSDEERDGLHARLVKLATPWAERVYQRIEGKRGASYAAEIIFRYGEAFDANYRRYSTASQSVRDIEHLEALHDDQPIAADLFVDPQGCINLRIFQLHDVLLSDMLPVLDDFGLIVIDQYSNTIDIKYREQMTLDTFRLKGVWGVSDEDVVARSGMLVDALEAVFDQKVEDDLLNRVLLRSAIPWQAVDILRAYLGYARQLGMRYTLARVRELLLAQPEMVHTLWDLFQTRFDPTQASGRTKRYAALSETFIDDLRAVDDHDQDVVFRTLFNLIDSSLRTNFYRTDRLGWYLSFKVDCAKVWQMPEPRMMYEIYVHHRVVEGLHLRGGPIARGGIRWSDRSDYRREILDLVSTQMVKNVLIVPEGSKGGYFLKKSVADRGQLRQRADDMYEILIRGVLDLTDNIVNGAVVPPPDVVRHDGDDPYMVVAADKGTAHLSDRANGISKAYGFWLGDAFASGGSQGYDHKVVGITARGAWKTAARHFRELGIDPYKEDFTCFGVGDPSGDVFGNGVIETPHLRLQAAFNHMHVFLDPNPDTPRAHAELKRLFAAAKGWGDYDQSIISQGGGIYSRRAKSIQLSPEAQKMLGTLESDLPVDAVVRLILRMNSDLYWNGGIGTYVKSSSESHQQAKDPTNDNLRINADELRCRVVAEGGNLGFTPEGRIEYALKGGRMNTDAIDNSGGVDMSDHEVNLKILLGNPVARGDMSEDQRNRLLQSLTTTVANQVLRNNDTHGRQLSLDQRRATRDPLFFWPTIQWVTTRSGQSCADLHLPTHDALKRRAAARQGLTRPELSVLQAFVKMHVFKALMNDDENLIPDFDQHVHGYFPKAIETRLHHEIEHHMLRKHIGMTVVTTDVCGDAGASYFPNLMELTGASAASVAAAWFRAMTLIKAPKLRASLKSGVPNQESRYRAWIAVTDAALRLAATWLAPGQTVPDADQLALTKDVLKRLPKIRGTVHTGRLQRRSKTFRSAGVPADLSNRIAALGELTIAREIALLHTEGDRIADTIVRYLAIGKASRMLPAVRALEIRSTQDRWDPIAMAIVRNRYLTLLRTLFADVPVGAEVRLGVDRLARRLARTGTGAIETLQDEMDRILGNDPDLATLLVAEERVHAWLARFQEASAQSTFTKTA